MKNILRTTLLLLLLTIAACKKQDISSTSPAVSPSGKFLSLPSSSPSYLQRIAQKIHEQNRAAGFLPKIEKEEGIPVWDKAKATVLPGENSSSSDTLVLLPLVREGEKQTSGFLVCKVGNTEADIVDLVRSRYYEAYGFNNNTDKITANIVALQSMLFDEEIFGDSTFELTDSRLFSSKLPKRKTNNGSTIISIRESKSSVAARSMELIPKTNTVCYTVTHKGNEGNLVGAAPGEDPDYYYTEEICYTDVVFTPTIPSFPTGGGSPLPGGAPATGSLGGSGSASSKPTTWYNGCQEGKLMLMSDGIKKTECVEFTEKPAWKPSDIDDELNFDDNVIPPFVWKFSQDDGTTFTDPAPFNQPSFQFDPVDNYENKYPRFTNMVKNLKTFVKENPKVLNALQAYSGFTKQKIIEHLTFGKGPLIKVKEMEKRFGYYNKDEDINTLYVRASYVRGLEQAFLQSTQEGTAFLLAVTILHEYVHFGTGQNNINEGIYDFGFGFERDAFNVTIDDDNAGKVVVNFSKYF